MTYTAARTVAELTKLPSVAIFQLCVDAGYPCCICFGSDYLQEQEVQPRQSPSCQLHMMQSNPYVTWHTGCCYAPGNTYINITCTLEAGMWLCYRPTHTGRPAG